MSIKKVFIDSREQDFGKKCEVFFKGKKINTQVKALEDGDLLLILGEDLKLAIERKTLSDFCSSYISKHIQDQALRLANKYPHRACIVYGDIKELKKVPTLRRINENSINKMIRTVNMIYALPTFWVQDQTQYFRTVLELAEIVQKHNGDIIDGQPAAVKKNKPIDIALLSCISDIGEKKAKILLDAFKTPEAVLNASRKELLSVKGIGDSMVGNVNKLKKGFYGGKR